MRIGLIELKYDWRIKKRFERYFLESFNLVLEI